MFHCRVIRATWLAALILMLTASAAAADDEVRFRRTTPRADLQRDGSTLHLGVPGGRAWGLESQLIRVQPGAGAVTLELAVGDEAVREAFVRIAWYERDEGRPRQIAIVDSPFVAAGEGGLVRVRLEPPDGAIAYRVRVLARVYPGIGSSDPGAVVVGMGSLGSGGRPSLTRLRAPP